MLHNIYDLFSKTVILLLEEVIAITLTIRITLGKFITLTVLFIYFDYLGFNRYLGAF